MFVSPGRQEAVLFRGGAAGDAGAERAKHILETRPRQQQRLRENFAQALLLLLEDFFEKAYAELLFRNYRSSRANAPLASFFSCPSALVSSRET